MQQNFSSEPHLDQIARGLDAAARLLFLVSLAAVAVHIPAKLLGCY